MLIERRIGYDGKIYDHDKVKIAIERLQAFEPPEGYHLAFSGGKDSQCIYHLAKMAGVKFDAHYNITTVDPPDLIYFIRKNYPDVIADRPEKTMWQLIVEKKIVPTRQIRYCCEYLKEHSGTGRTLVTGTRWEESVKRRNGRGLIELNAYTKTKIMLNNDNEETRRLYETCVMKSKHMLNPIIEWSESDVWHFLNGNKIEHCILYDEGWKRIGCIGCPMAGKDGMLREFERYPKFKAQYIRTFDKMVQERKKYGLSTDNWSDGKSVMDWWIYGCEKEKVDENQFTIWDV